MSLVITGNTLLISLFFLIAINGFFCFVKKPILGFPIAGISFVFLIGFGIDFNGIDILLTLILICCIVANIVVNYDDYKK